MPPVIALLGPPNTGKTYLAMERMLEHAKTLAAVAECPLFDASAKVEALYLATLGRRPHSTELEKFVKYVEAGGKSNEALSDVFWALLNSSEFVLNH